MKKLEYTLSFTTHAFLGNADQSAQWRTPPFKALLRQWWRIRNAKQHQYNHRNLREFEGDLFGNAWLEPQNGRSRFRKSRVMLRLDQWDGGKLSSSHWPGGEIESVVTTQDGKGRVRADVYLGFGPVLPPSRKENRPSVTIRGAIGTGKEDGVVMSLFPFELAQSLRDVLQLMAWFGTIGSRARNGWGSLRMEPRGEAPVLAALPKSGDALVLNISRPWMDCLDRDWPHALGSLSGTPLVWVTQPYEDWRKAMGCLANIRVAVRRVAKGFAGPSGIGGIHLLGYPAGEKWEQGRLGKDARLGTQLRFKVAQTAGGPVGVVSHFPCALPAALKEKLDANQRNWIDQNERQLWKAIHDNLNSSNRVKPLS